MNVNIHIVITSTQKNCFWSSTRTDGQERELVWVFAYFNFNLSIIGTGMYICARDSPVSKYFFQWRSYIYVICFEVIVLNLFCTLQTFLVRLLMTFNMTIDNYMYCLLKLIAKGTPKRTLTKKFLLLKCDLSCFFITILIVILLCNNITMLVIKRYLLWTYYCPFVDVII